MSESTLEVRNISKSFGRRRVLKDVSFSSHRGEIIGIVGENGVGKTTLLKILMGFSKPNSGSVHMKGKVGYCPQDLLIFERLTVRENFHYFASAYKLPGKEPSWEKNKDDLLKRFRFSQYEHTLASRLSGGTKQKLNLSLALLHSPDLIILDEPYAAFDWETYLHFWDYAIKLRNQGRNILVVSHFFYDRSRLDTLYILKDGVMLCG